MTLPLIAPGNLFLLWAVVLGLVAFGFWSEQATRWGRVLTGIVTAMTAAMVLAAAKVIPTVSPVYDSIFDLILPLAIPLLLFRADLRALAREGGMTLAAFGLGAVGIMVGSMIATILVPLGERLAAIAAGMITATYIGGSSNFAAVAVAADYQNGPEIPPLVAADVIATNIHIIFLIVLPGLVAWLRRSDTSAVTEADKPTQMVPFRLDHLDLAGLMLSLGTASALVWVGGEIARALGYPSFGIIITTALALLIGNLAPGLVRRMSGDQAAGIVCIYLFLVAVAAGADVWTLGGRGLTYFAFIFVVLVVHLVILLGIGRLVGIGLPELVVASTACIGGGPSAGAIATAKGWRHLVTPGILVGTAGTAVGTFAGVAVWQFLL